MSELSFYLSSVYRHKKVSHISQINADSYRVNGPKRQGRHSFRARSWRRKETASDPSTSLAHTSHISQLLTNSIRAGCIPPRVTTTCHPISAQDIVHITSHPGAIGINRFDCSKTCSKTVVISQTIFFGELRLEFPVAIGSHRIQLSASILALSGP